VISPPVVEEERAVRRLVRSLAVVRSAVVLCVVALGASAAQPLVAPAGAAPQSYCATLSKLMSDTGSSSFAADPALLTKKAKAFRDSNPPADIKKAVNDFASGLDDLASVFKSLKSKPDPVAIGKKFGPGSKYQTGLAAILRYEATTCSGAAAPTTSNVTASKEVTASASIPESAAITALAAHIQGNPKAAPIVQSCVVATTLDLQENLSKKPSPSAAARITQLAGAVRAFDPKVADAIAKASLKDVAHWCKHHDFAN
jgi:hypothetical protein